MKSERLRRSIEGREDLLLSIPLREGMSLVDALAYALDDAGLTELDAGGSAAAAKALLDRKAISPTGGGDATAAFWAALNGVLPR